MPNIAATLTPFYFGLLPGIYLFDLDNLKLYHATRGFYIYEVTDFSPHEAWPMGDALEMRPFRGSASLEPTR